jgi:hypothetical protein
MKNIHVLPTDKDSKLYLGNLGKPVTIQSASAQFKKPLHIYITSHEEIKEGDWFMSDFNSFPIHNIKELSERKGTLGWEQKDLKNNLKIILTTDQDLIKDGVQAIDDTFLEWFVKNPSCESVEVVSAKTIPALQLTGNGHCWWKIIIPKKEPKQETLEEFINSQPYYGSCTPEYLEGIEEGAKWQAERMYSEEDMFKFLDFINNRYYGSFSIDKEDLQEWFEQFKNK